MAEALTSGRTWKEDPEGNPSAQTAAGGSSLRWVRDDNERRVRARFKSPPSSAVRYAMAMERLAYVLGDRLGVPIPPTYIEECDGIGGCAQLRVAGVAWRHAEAGVPLLFANVLNRDVWPLAIVFDVWLANPDRNDRNIMFEPEPADVKPGMALEGRTWFVDNERCGLWPTTKFGAAAVVENVNLTPEGSMLPEVEAMIGKSMPSVYRQAFEDLDVDGREPYFQNIRDVTDNEIDAAVSETCPAWCSTAARDLTMQLLRARRDNIANLANAVFPL